LRLIQLSAVLLGLGFLQQLAATSVTPLWLPFAASIALGVGPIARRAAASIRAAALDINVLMLVAVAGAAILGEWNEAAAVVFLFALAQLLEARAMDRARGAIRGLMELAPAEAVVRRDGVTATLPVDAVQVNDIIVVRPGEKIPLDGEVAAGLSHLNQAPVTGESLPVEKQPGDAVFAGTINGRGALDVRVTRLRRDSTLARIIHLVERAQAQRAPTQSFVDRFARIYTPIVLVLALLVAFVPPLAFGAAWSEWTYRALVLLVISCPCALVISTPVSIVSALAAAARKGVLIKGGARLERLAAVKCVAFDKTGTLTKGQVRVESVVPFDGMPPADIVRLAASLETHSEHPIGRAILRQAKEWGLAAVTPTGFQAIPGRGAEGFVDQSHVVVGSHRLFEERGLCSPRAEEILAELESRGSSTVMVAADGRPAGFIGVADEPRETAHGVVEMLRAQGVEHIALLTGDYAAPAGALARSLTLDTYRASLLPEDKAAAVHELRAQFGALAMVGDGVNDAPALASADVGIAMGAIGTDAALETADVALMSDELVKIPFAIRLSRATARNIRINIAFSLTLKAAFLIMAVAGTASLWAAVVADTGASLIVIANALRLLRE
jgi:Cd2+/Zn2+-exporting ATPase